MTEANVIFILDGAKLAIQCTPIDKMKDICQKYSSKIKKDMNSLLFSYKGNQLNLESNFKDQVNLKDKNTDEMIILVNKRDDNVYSNRKNLIENIKSIYFIKILFSHMNEKNKLKLLKYNKNLQETMDFKLINYKFYSGRYIIYDTNGKGREYSGEDDKLIFEGEYLNGKKNGKGKEYYSNGELFYEGEYLNGKINGKGKEYNYEGKLIFEGEYLNGKRWNGKGKKYLNGKIEFDTEYLNGINLTNKVYDKNGKLYEISKNIKGFIKEYDHKGNLTFEGEYLNGKRNGKGKYYYDNGILYFEGEYLNGERNGKGKEYRYYGELRFEGEYLNGKRNGKGKKYNKYSRLKFEGEYLNGKKNGKGKEYNCYGNLIFEGEYLNGIKWSGKGYDKQNNTIYVLNNGKGYIKEYNDEGDLYFEGELLNGQRNGKGKEYCNYTLIFEGEYLYSHRLRGKEYSDELCYTVYEGDFLYDKKWNGKGYIENDDDNDIIYELKNGTGKVMEYYENGRLKFEGEYLNGKRNGKGKEYECEYYSLEFEGEYLNGQKNGKGKEYNIDGNLIFEGEFKNDKRNGKGKEFFYNGNLRSEGEYLDGKWNGLIKLYNFEGKLEFEGEYKNGEKVLKSICLIIK